MYLIEGFCPIQKQTLRQHMENVSIDDTKSSVLLRKMHLLSSSKASKNLLKTIWIQRLRSTITAIVTIENNSS